GVASTWHPEGVPGVATPRVISGASPDVASRVRPFVVDPIAPFPSLDPLHASDANNFAILDFLLFLKYIEAAFYALNVPHFYHCRRPAAVSGRGGILRREARSLTTTRPPRCDCGLT